jgi:hypothetical protein
MSDFDSTTQFAASRALEKAEDNGESIADMQKKLASLGLEVHSLVAFNQRLLDLLKLRLKLDDQDLDLLIRRAEDAEFKSEERPGVRIAPLCLFCDRPMQDGSVACIYCGRSPE